MNGPSIFLNQSEKYSEISMHDNQGNLDENTSGSAQKTINAFPMNVLSQYD